VALGEAAFNAAWTAGATLPLAQVIAEALADDGPVAPTTRETATLASRWAPLTEREHEVALLVVRGLTNRQIAAELSISGRTVDRHVANILDKLDLTARTQIAAWAVQR
jgi:DNA-binding NarL/FixJ family response regulator